MVVSPNKNEKEIKTLCHENSNPFFTNPQELSRRKCGEILLLSGATIKLCAILKEGF